MNREQAVRTGFYEALKGLLLITVSGNSINVPIYDAKLESADDIYVLLTNQAATYTGDMHRFRWRCSQTIEIVHNQTDSAVKDVLDLVSDKIEDIILFAPTGKPGGNGLIQQVGWTMQNVVLNSVNCLALEVPGQGSDIYMQKIIEFNLDIMKN
jgi:hypothetical protein